MTKSDQGARYAYVVYNERFNEIFNCYKRLNNECNIFMAKTIVIHDALNYIVNNGNLHSHHLNIQLSWTKAHIGTLGNEHADELAKMATQKTKYILIVYLAILVSKKRS